MRALFNFASEHLFDLLWVVVGWAAGRYLERYGGPLGLFNVITDQLSRFSDNLAKGFFAAVFSALSSPLGLAIAFILNILGFVALIKIMIYFPKFVDEAAEELGDYVGSYLIAFVLSFSATMALMYSDPTNTVKRFGEYLVALRFIPGLTELAALLVHAVWKVALSIAAGMSASRMGYAILEEARGGRFAAYKSVYRAFVWLAVATIIVVGLPQLQPVIMDIMWPVRWAIDIVGKILDLFVP